jgi:hypothetical protein
MLLLALFANFEAKCAQNGSKIPKKFFHICALEFISHPFLICKVQFDQYRCNLLHSIELFLINKKIFILSVRFLQETDHDWAYWSIDGYKYPGKNTRRNLKPTQ